MIIDSVDTAFQISVLVSALQIGESAVNRRLTSSITVDLMNAPVISTVYQANPLPLKGKK